MGFIVAAIGAVVGAVAGAAGAVASGIGAVAGAIGTSGLALLGGAIMPSLLGAGSAGGAVTPSPVAISSPYPTEKISGADEARQLEQDRIRRMRGRLSTFLTKGLLSEPTTQSAKLGA